MTDIQESARVAAKAGWLVDSARRVIRARHDCSIRVRVYDLYALSKLAAFDQPKLGPPALSYPPEPFPWQFALQAGWELERPEYLRAGPLFDSKGRLLVEDVQPRRIAFWQIEQFADARHLDVSDFLDKDTELALVPDHARKTGEDRYVKEEQVKGALHRLPSEPYADKDNPTEMHDIFSSRVLLAGQERDAAFLLKGPGIGGPTRKRRSLTRARVDIPWNADRTSHAKPAR